MDEASVNVESRTSSQDKRWTIMAALLGTNTAFMLFQGIEQERNFSAVREVALTIIAAAIPFQGIYFLIYTYVMENNGTLSESHLLRLEKLLLFAKLPLTAPSLAWRSCGTISPIMLACFSFWPQVPQLF